MRFSRQTFIAIAGLATLAAAALARPASKPQGYDAFSTVRTRNIFDPDRQPGVAAAAPQAVQTPPPSRSDYAALTGTLISADKTLAFFSGSRPEFSKVLPAGGEIAGATVIKITSSAIEVERDGKRITVAVGQTLPLDGTSQPTAAPASIPVTTTSSPTATAPSTTSAPASGIDREAVMRRMMEKRQQELK